MWILFAFGSALFSGATAILAKCGIRNTDSNVVTAFRTVVVLLFSWLMVWITGSFSSILKDFYGSEEEVGAWDGYVVFAIDGTEKLQQRQIFRKV